MENFISKLPNHVLELVVDHLNLPDLYRFGWVCKPWKSICNPVQFHNHLPWLIVPTNTNPNSSKQSMVFEDIKDIGFFSLRDKKIYKAELPELLDRRICGSFPGGWLMTVHENKEMQLFNPFLCSKEVIHLPPLTKFAPVLRTKVKDELYRKWLLYFPSKDVRDKFIHKVAISSSRITKGTILVALQSMDGSLSYYRIGGDQCVWTPFSPDMRPRMLTDVTFYKGKFYAVHNNGYVVVIHGLEEEEEKKPTKIIVEKVIDEPTRGEFSNKHYILESGGDLLVVRRFTKQDYSLTVKGLYKLYNPPHRTIGFRVLKLEFGTPNNSRWVVVESLGNYSLFLGYNMSFSVSSMNSSGCKANCIYFTDDKPFFTNRIGGYDMGIFHLVDGSIEKFIYPSDRLVVPPPIWLAPNPS